MQANFCGNCGASLRGVDRDAEGVGDGVGPSRRWGEIRQVTALSADIVGSTELIADLNLDPELAMGRLRPIVTIMCDEVTRFGGVVLSTTGDGIFAVFGAPRAEEGHALLACEAALAIQHALADSHGAVRIRVGLHSGAVVADALDGAGPLKQAVYGLTAHVANRLQAFAAPGSVVMSMDCHSLVRTVSNARPLGLHALRGISQELRVFELLGLRPVATSQYFRHAGLSRFRGRDREMALLQRHLDEPDGPVRVVGLAGGAGLGKSRLCFEFAEQCRAQGVPVYEVRTQPYGRAAPLQPVLEFLRSAFGIARTRDPAVARRKITRQLRELQPALGRDLPILFDFLGISETGAAPFIAPTTRHDRLVAIIRTLIAHFGRARSVVIGENLHWLDEASEALLATLLDSFVTSRILLVFNYRPSYTPRWLRNEWVREHALHELSQTDIERLVEEHVGQHPALAHLRLRIAFRSGGNPFFAEELVRSLVGLASSPAGNGHPAAPELPPSTALPMTVQAAIAARLDNLSDIDRSLLQVAAVIGQAIELPILRTVADLPDQQIRQGLDRLCAAGLLQVTAALWTFRHPLIQEVAYGMQLRARRELLHAAIARAMLEHHGGRIGEVSALIAYHYEAAGQVLEAARQMEVAARWVGSKSPAQATLHWRKVRDLLQQSLGDPAARALSTQASMQIAWLGWREGMAAAAAPFAAALPAPRRDEPAN